MGACDDGDKTRGADDAAAGAGAFIFYLKFFLRQITTKIRVRSSVRNSSELVPTNLRLSYKEHLKRSVIECATLAGRLPDSFD